jgi:hypothetical protein
VVFKKNKCGGLNMLYYSDYNVAFHHIPRTAGSSTREWMSKNLSASCIEISDVHDPLKSLSKYPIDSMKIVTHIRNPFERAVSLYFWFKLSAPSDGCRFPFKQIAVDCSFPEWVNKWFITENQLSIEDMLCVDGTVPNNVYIVRYENLKEDLKKIYIDQMEMPLNVTGFPHVYKTDHDYFYNYYDAETLEAVGRKEFWAIKTYYSSDNVCQEVLNIIEKTYNVFTPVEEPVKELGEIMGDLEEISVEPIVIVEEGSVEPKKQSWVFKLFNKIRGWF